VTEPSLSRDELERLVAAGEVDTVIVAFSDMLGRLMGKRVSARFFIDEVVESGAEACNYLFAVDVEMNTVEGYAMSGWSSGYGDMVMRPDLSTLRRAPWLPGTALVLADLIASRRKPYRTLAAPGPTPPTGPVEPARSAGLRCH